MVVCYAGFVELLRVFIRRALGRAIVLGALPLDQWPAPLMRNLHRKTIKALKNPLKPLVTVRIKTMSQYNLSVELATAELLKLDPRQTAANAGGIFDADKRLLKLKFMDRHLVFDYSRSALFWGDSGEEFDPVASVAVLHYLVNAKGDQPTGDLLAYRDLWGAGTQSGPFIDRPEKLLAEKYGAIPDLILSRAEELSDAVVEKYGDLRLDIYVLPHLPLTVLLYAADEDLPAGAKILYDSVTSRYLPTEDCVWLAEYVAERLAG